MNIIHGHSAAGSFKQAFHIPIDEILVFSDELSCGPLNKFTDVETWKNFRQEFWCNIGEDNTIEYGAYAFSEFQRDLYENFKELNYSFILRFILKYDLFQNHQLRH